MKLTVKKEVFRKYPKFRLGFILIDYCNYTENLEESRKLLQETEMLTKLTYHNDTLKNHDLLRTWTLAQEDFGKKTPHYHTSVEKLFNVIKKGKTTATKNTVQNLINYVSLKYMIPFGADEYDLIKGDVTFALAKGNERRNILKSLHKGDIYYKDDKGILGTKMDFWKSPRTKLRPPTPRVLIHIDALPPVDKSQLNAIMKEVKSLFEDFCHAKVKTFVLDKGKNSVRF